MTCIVGRDDRDGYVEVPRLAGHEWTDHANSDPISDVDAAVGAYCGRHARYPTFLEVSSLALHRALQSHPLILDRIKLTTYPSRPGPRLLAAIFDLDGYRIAGLELCDRTSARRDRSGLDAVSVRARLVARRIAENVRRWRAEGHGPWEAIPTARFVACGLTEDEVRAWDDHWHDIQNGGFDLTPLPPFLAELGDVLFAVMAEL